MMLHHEYKDLLGSGSGIIYLSISNKAITNEKTKKGKKKTILPFILSFLRNKKLFYFLSSGEKTLQKLIKSGKSPTTEQWNADDIKNIVTAKNLCSCTDPITTAFDVSCFHLTA